MTELMTEFTTLGLPRQKRKILLRSTGSFSILEEKIVAPTPRKFPNLPCSPKATRKEKISGVKDEGIFGEAGFEIQSILLSSFESGNPSSVSSVSLVSSSEPETSSSSKNEEMLPKSCECLVVVEEEENSTSKSARVSSPPHPLILSTPPLRSSNPITLNSPFHQLEEYERITPRVQPIRKLKFANGFSSSKDLHRSRSASWPSVPKLAKKSATKT
jgi:hypothetical protein